MDCANAEVVSDDLVINQLERGLRRLVSREFDWGKSVYTREPSKRRIMVCGRGERQPLGFFFFKNHRREIYTQLRRKLLRRLEIDSRFGDYGRCNVCVNGSAMGSVKTAVHVSVGF